MLKEQSIGLTAFTKNTSYTADARSIQSLSKNSFVDNKMRRDNPYQNKSVLQDTSMQMMNFDMLRLKKQLNQNNQQMLSTDRYFQRRKSMGIGEVDNKNTERQKS